MTDHSLNRRHAMAMMAIAAGTVATGIYALPSDRSTLPPPNPEGLRRHAARKGMSFGTMVPLRDLPSETAMRAVRDEADMIVPGIALKWGENEKIRGRPDYRAAEATYTFARKNGLTMRGHAAFWYRNIPGWARETLMETTWQDAILRRVTDVVGHFKGRIVEWDVVNEAIQPSDGLQAGFRRAPFGKQTDPGWIADCFQAAHAADPAARLMYNDYGLENATGDDEARRTAVLALLEDLVKRGAPIHALGLQTHIGVGQRFDAKRYRTFLSDVAALGLKLRITEFDVGDLHAPADITERDIAVADRATELLTVAFDEKAMLGMLCWGLSDANTSVQPPRSDGQPHRALPLDVNWNRKPLWSAIARAFDNAPNR